MFIVLFVFACLFLFSENKAYFLVAHYSYQYLDLRVNLVSLVCQIRLDT